MGMWVFLVVLGVFFASTMIAFVAVRLDLADSRDWSRTGDPPLPAILLWSTAALAVSSGAIWRAQRLASRGGEPRAWLAGALLFGLVFLSLQSLAWLTLWRDGLTARSDLYAWTFHVLTGLHAAHLLAGLGVLGWVAWRKVGDEDRFRRRAQVRYAAMYWHFLGVAWLAFYGLLWWASR